MRTLSGLALAITLPALAADDPAKLPADWKEYAPKDRSFAVWLPKGEEKEDKATVHVKGAFLRIRMVRVEPTGGPSFGAGVLILPLKYRKASSSDLVDAIRDSYVKGVKGKVASEKDVKRQGVQGKEFMVETGTGVTRLRVFAVAGRAYRADVSGSKEQVGTKDADTFLDSFKLPARAVR